MPDEKAQNQPQAPAQGQAQSQPEKLTDEEVARLVKKFSRRGGRRNVKADNSHKADNHVREVKAKAEKEKPEGKTKAKRVVGVRLIETKYGKRVLIEQGQNRLWLREADIVQLLTILAREAFGKEEVEE
jgi:hypothetical protein